MEPAIYFDKESPDYNFGLWGNEARIAANRVVLCVLTEYGLCNDRRMHARQVNRLIESIQETTGRFANVKHKIKLKDEYIKKRCISKPIRTIGPATLTEHISESIPVENTS